MIWVFTNNHELLKITDYIYLSVLYLTKIAIRCLQNHSHVKSTPWSWWNDPLQVSGLVGLRGYKDVTTGMIMDPRLCYGR